MGAREDEGRRDAGAGSVARFLVGLWRRRAITEKRSTVAMRKRQPPMIIVTHSLPCCAAKGRGGRRCSKG